MEENKAVVRRLIEEVVNTGNLGAAEELYAPDYAPRDAPVSGDARGPEAATPLLAAYRAAYPDFRMTVEDQVAEGDRVATRYVARGTHEGEIMGVPPTHNRFEVSGICIHRVVGGKIVEDWWQANELGVLLQLGIIPSSFLPG